MNPGQICRRVPQTSLLAAALISGTSAAVFGLLYFSFYWPYRDLFNEEGRYFEAHAAVVHHEQSGLLMFPALAFLALALFLAVVWWVRRRPAGTSPGGP